MHEIWGFHLVTFFSCSLSIGRWGYLANFLSYVISSVFFILFSKLLVTCWISRPYLTHWIKNIMYGDIISSFFCFIMPVSAKYSVDFVHTFQWSFLFHLSHKNINSYYLIIGNHRKLEVRTDDHPTCNSVIIWGDAISSGWFNFGIVILMYICNRGMGGIIMLNGRCKYIYGVVSPYRNKIWWLCIVPTSTTRFATEVGYRMAKI